jgi:hypothetical protein
VEEGARPERQVDPEGDQPQGQRAESDVAEPGEELADRVEEVLDVVAERGQGHRAKRTRLCGSS